MLEDIIHCNMNMNHNIHIYQEHNKNKIHKINEKKLKLQELVPDTNVKGF